MLSKNQAKLVRSLQSKKQRIQHKLFVAEGNKTIFDLIEGQMEVHLCCATPEWKSAESSLLEALDIPMLEVDERTLSQISSLQSPPGILAVFNVPEFQFEEKDLSRGLHLFLEKINDPGNLGTLVRIADWFGIKNIICSSDCVDLYNPKCVSASMGSLARVNVHYTDLDDLLSKAPDTFPQIGVYGAILNQTSVYSTSLSEDAWLVMGSESHGISKSLQDLIPNPISIPAFGGAESLNVATAAAVLCSEFRRSLS